MKTKLLKLLLMSTLFLFVSGCAPLQEEVQATVQAGMEQTPHRNIEPYADALECVHDSSVAHGLWNFQDGCHYTHTHNAVNADIGDFPFTLADVLGQDIGVPWIAEKHEGYKYYVNLAPYPKYALEGYLFLNPQPNYVTAFMVEHHDAGGNKHLTKRTHSYYIAAQIESRTGEIGYAYFGGIADFGCAMLPYKQEPLRLPDDPVDESGVTTCDTQFHPFGADPYRAGSTLDDIVKIQDVMAHKGSYPLNKWIWTAHDRYGYNQLGYFFFRTLDSWAGQDPNDPKAEHLICPDFQCPYNNSIENIFNIVVQVPASMDTDNDGYVDYEGYTDEKGNIVEGCTVPDVGCVPLILSHAPVGKSIWSRNTSGPEPNGEQFIDHDIYFEGNTSGWIQFPFPLQ